MVVSIVNTEWCKSFISSRYMTWLDKLSKSFECCVAIDKIFPPLDLTSCILEIILLKPSLVTIKTTGTNQEGKVVCTFKRQILIPFEGYAVEDKIENY